MHSDKRHNIGILGGTFDPVHQGHLAVAREVLVRFRLDTVLFIPAPAPPHKEHSLTPFAHRVAMLEAALDDEPGLGLSILEAERPSPSYTVDTLEELHQRLDPCKLHLIVGADMFMEIDLWYRFEHLFHLADLIVAARPGVTDDSVRAKVAALPGTFRFEAARSAWCRQDGFRIYYMDDTALTLSSSRIREMLARGEPVADAVPGPVLAYIRDHRLYTTRG